MVSLFYVFYRVSLTVLLFVTEDEDIEHQLVIRKLRHLSLCAVEGTGVFDSWHISNVERMGT